MKARKQFNKLRETMMYIVKENRYYKPIYLDVENNICKVKEVQNPNKATEQNTKTFDEANALYTIEIITDVITPDKYFLQRIKESDVDLIVTIRSKKLISYLIEHLGECKDVLDKLKEFALTSPKVKVKKAAFEVYKSVVETDQEFFKEYQKSCLPELSPIDTEKAIILYLALIKKNVDLVEDRSKIRYRKFSDEWDTMFGYIKEDGVKNMKIQAFKEAHNTLDKLTIEQICEYRNNYKIFKGTEVPKELRKLAMHKGVIVTLAENQYKHLSGFDIMRIKGKNDTQRLTRVPFGLSEDEAIKFLNDIPSQKEIVEKENKVMKILEDTSLSEKEKIKYVCSHNTKIATHRFEVFMNRFCLKQCKQKQLLNECCLMCQRNGILNLSNKKTIEYTFCTGSGKRKQTIKRINTRRKGNKKAKKRESKDSNN